MGPPKIQEWCAEEKKWFFELTFSVLPDLQPYKALTWLSIAYVTELTLYNNITKITCKKYGFQRYRINYRYGTRIVINGTWSNVLSIITDKRWKRTIQFIIQRYEAEESPHKKWSFLLRVSSVNVTKSAVFRGFAYIY